MIGSMANNQAVSRMAKRETAPWYYEGYSDPLIPLAVAVDAGCRILRVLKSAPARLASPGAWHRKVGSDAVRRLTRGHLAPSNRSGATELRRLDLG